MISLEETYWRATKHTLENVISVAKKDDYSKEDVIHIFRHMLIRAEEEHKKHKDD